jgi:hypothetical protein
LWWISGKVEAPVRRFRPPETFLPSAKDFLLNREGMTVISKDGPDQHDPVKDQVISQMGYAGS